MAVTQDYAILEQLPPDPRLRTAFKALLDRLAELERAAAVTAPPLTSAQLSQVRTALQAGGSHPLRVDNLRGRLADPQP